MKGCGTGIYRKGEKMQWEAEPHNNLQLNVLGGKTLQNCPAKMSGKRARVKEKTVLYSNVVFLLSISYSLMRFQMVIENM